MQIYQFVGTFINGNSCERRYEGYNVDVYAGATSRAADSADRPKLEKGAQRLACCRSISLYCKLREMYITFLVLVLCLLCFNARRMPLLPFETVPGRNHAYGSLYANNGKFRKDIFNI